MMTTMQMGVSSPIHLGRMFTDSCLCSSLDVSYSIHPTYSLQAFDLKKNLFLNHHVFFLLLKKNVTERKRKNMLWAKHVILSIMVLIFFPLPTVKSKKRLWFYQRRRIKSPSCICC